MEKIIIQRGSVDAFEKAILNGKYVVYGNQTEFLIQVGKDGKASYKTKYTIKGNLNQAVMLYNKIELSPGEKKRLLQPSCSRNPILAKSSQLKLPFFDKATRQTAETVLLQAQGC